MNTKSEMKFPQVALIVKSKFLSDDLQKDCLVIVNSRITPDDQVFYCTSEKTTIDWEAVFSSSEIFFLGEL